jgi:Ca-activated chloride channel family protein
MNSTDKYLVGKYDVEVLTLPRTYLTLEVNQSSTAYVDVLAPGFLTYRSGNLVSAQVFIKREDNKLEWVCNIDPTLLTGSWQLQPGDYRIVYRQKKLKSSLFTIEKEFRIYSNKTTSVNL